MRSRVQTFMVVFALSALSWQCAHAPTIRTEPVGPATHSMLVLYEDAEYKFTGHGYGSRGDETPSFFAFNKGANNWVRISHVSTRDAVFGSSPDPGRVPILPIGWDHSRLSEQKFVEFPLVTGAVMLPDDIRYDAAKQAYCLSIGSRYGEHSHPTILYIRKRDLDACFQMQ